MNWYLKVLKQYADFSGRARRKEYWMFTLFNVIGFAVIYALTLILAFAFESLVIGFVGMFLYLLFGLAILVPSLAVIIRRLHDIGKDGINILFYLIPLAGPIIILIWMCQEGEAKENQWGRNPKEEQE